MAGKAIRNPFADGLPTLGQVEIPADRLALLFNCDKRYQESMLQRFIYLNRKSLAYLDVKASITQRQSRLYLTLESSRYVGTVPLYSPGDGKCFCDLRVVGRYNEEVGEVVSLLEHTVRPEYCADLPLHSRSALKASIVLECCRFVEKYLEADRFHWIKFSRRARTEAAPRGQTDWNRYAQRSHQDPAQALRFHNNYSILTAEHREWHQLNYVLQLALDILSHHSTPMRIRAAYNQKIETLSRKLQQASKLKVSEIRINGNDPAVVKEAKRLGNIILNDDRQTHMAWRIDYAEFFERYVQHIIMKVAAQKGARTYDNAHLPIHGTHRPAWGLLYLEPDIIYVKEDQKVVIDAKYKSHIFNWDSATDELRESFRQDLHQVLAYSAFATTAHKTAALVYPYSHFTARTLLVRDPHSAATATLHLIGLPISKTHLPSTLASLAPLLP